MAAVRSSYHHGPAMHRVNFREQDSSYNKALHPRPVRNYSNPAGQSPATDMNDFLRRSGPNPAEQQLIEEQQRKGGKLSKKQKPAGERTFKKRLFGTFRSKKTQEETAPPSTYADDSVPASSMPT